MTLARTFAPVSLFTSIALTRADKRYQHLREQVSQPLFLVAPRSGVVMDVNHKAVEFTGFTRDELFSLSLSELIPAQEGEAALRHIRALTPGIVRQIERVPLRTRTGRSAYVLVRASRASDPNDGEPIVFLLVEEASHPAGAQNGADRSGAARAALDALSALLLHASPSTLDNAVFLCREFLSADVAGLYRVMTAEPGLQLIASSEIPGEFPLLLEPTDPAALPAPTSWHSGERPVSALSAAARKSGLGALYTHPLGEENASSGLLLIGYRINSPIPHETPVLVRVAARYLTALIITLVRSHADVLRQTRFSEIEHCWSALLAETSDGAITFDADGVVTRLNPAAERIIGFAEGEVAGADIGQVVVSAEALADSVREAIRRGERYEERDVSLVRRDGYEVFVHLRATPIPGERGRPPSGLIVISDLSEHKSLEAQSLHLARRAFLGDMSAIFAHEVRNPLNGISTGLQYIAMKAPPEDPIHDSVDKMMAEVDRIEQLLKRILLVAKPNEMHLEAVDIGKVLQRLLHRLGPRIERLDIKPELSADPDTPPIMADATQMEQVFTNLITNAVEAMAEHGGNLTVKVGCADGKEPGFGESVRVDVIDTGPGIPSGRLERIFDPFFTTRDEGTGLGLAITQRIVNAHRGKIEAQSWPAVGTVFTVYLPATRTGADERLEPRQGG